MMTVHELILVKEFYNVCQSIDTWTAYHVNNPTPAQNDRARLYIEDAVTDFLEALTAVDKVLSRSLEIALMERFPTTDDYLHGICSCMKEYFELYLVRSR